MTFEAEAKKQGRRPFIIVELDLGFCGNDYGVSPCAASGSAGGECYNTYGTCQDTPNFTNTTKTYKYSDVLLVGSGIIPCVKSVNTAPTEITPGKGLGARASCSVQLTDFIDTDVQTDPYVSTRSYIATDQGTYWGKWLARNPYYYRRTIRVKYGFLESDNSLTSIETYTYLIDSITLDNRSGNVKISGKDPLILADATKTKTPAASSGKLLADITAGATSLSVESGQGTEYDSAGRIDIGGEIIEYTTLTTDTFSGLTRGAQGTAAASHSTGDTVQKVRYWDNERPDTILQDLLEDDAGVDSAYIPISDWNDEADIWLSSYTLSANITKPEEVNKLVAELIEQSGVVIFSDDRDGAKIKFQVEAPVLGVDLASVVTLYDKDIIKDSLKISENSKDRISSVWFHHTLINPKDGAKKRSNFLITDVLSDAGSYSANAYNKEQIKEFHSRWVRSSTPAAVTSNRLIARFSETPKRIEFQIDPAAYVLSVGDHFYLESQDLQDETGAAQNIEFQVTSIDYDPKKTAFKIKALQFRFSGLRYAYFAPDAQADYTSATDDEKARYAFLCDTSTQQMSNGDDPYVFI